MKITRTTSEMIMFLANQDKDIKWDLTEHKERRSRSQNSYYWELAGRVAVRTSRFGANINQIHNRNLRELGLREYINDQPVCVYIPDTDEAEKAALDAESYHIKPTSQTRLGKDGRVFRCYVMLRGSHTFNTTEMSALVDLMVQEAKEVGVETMTPLELEHIRLLEAQAERKRDVHK
jgi:hypothetical protein